MKKERKITKPPLVPSGGDCPYFADGNCIKYREDGVPGLCKSPAGPGKKCVLNKLDSPGIKVEGILI